MHLVCNKEFYVKILKKLIKLFNFYTRKKLMFNTGELERHTLE